MKDDTVLSKDTASDNPSYDIILLLDYFRSATPYLSIIKYLSKTYRIGLYLSETEADSLKKNGEAHQRFIRRCIEYGAEQVAGGAVTCRMLIVQQRPYEESMVARIRRDVKADICVGYLALAMAGIEKHDRFLTQFDIGTVFVPDRKFMDYLLKARDAWKTYENIEIIEVGLPFASYPVHEGFTADYIIASPTGFSFHSERDKQIYFSNVLSLLDQVEPGSVVAYKQHNGERRDYFNRKGYSELSQVLSVIPGMRWLIRKIMEKDISCPTPVDALITTILYKLMIRKVIPIKDLTDDYEFAMEMFLPGVSGGVIGGLSNTIWGTRYFGLVFYNCVDIERQERGKVNKLLNKNSGALIDLNLGYFFVPCCNGILEDYSSRDLFPHDHPLDVVEEISLVLEKLHGYETS